MAAAYSHELSSAGFLPKGGEEGAFYAYAYPTPDGFREHPVGPCRGVLQRRVRRVLAALRGGARRADPDAALLEFLQTSYEAAAEPGGWDRRALEDDPARRARPR